MEGGKEEERSAEAERGNFNDKVSEMLFNFP
jgi:hypothetical protein